MMFFLLINVPVVMAGYNDKPDSLLAIQHAVFLHSPAQSSAALACFRLLHHDFCFA